MKNGFVETNWRDYISKLKRFFLLKNENKCVVKAHKLHLNLFRFKSRQAGSEVIVSQTYSHGYFFSFFVIFQVLTFI